MPPKRGSGSGPGVTQVKAPAVKTHGGKMSVAEAGRKGGEKTAKTHGHEFYQEIGRKGGEVTKERHGPDFYAQIGEKGGESRGRQREKNSERE